MFGPHPRDYRKDLPRRMRRQALKCALSEKVRQGNLHCLDSLDSLDGKTKSMAALLENLGISGSALVVTADSQTQVVRSAHNLPRIWTLPVNQLNAQDLLSRKEVVMTVDAARKAEEMWAAPLNHRQRRLAASGASAAPAESATPEEAPAPRRRRRAAAPTEEASE